MRLIFSHLRLKFKTHQLCQISIVNFAVFRLRNGVVAAKWYFTVVASTKKMTGLIISYFVAKNSSYQVSLKKPKKIY